MTTLTGSGCSRSPSHGFLSLEAAWVAHIDEDFQAERWGADAEAVARREARWREFEAAGVAVAVGPRSDTWTSRASLKPRLPRTAKKIWFSLSTILAKVVLLKKRTDQKRFFPRPNLDDFVAK